jgi:arabinan endo-1,5-alpha-L-arabinosidase
MRRPAAAAATLLTAALVAVAATARAQTSGANATHDPSRVIESDGKFYFCSTGGNCASSTDGLVWRTTGLRIPIPAWAPTYAPGGNQGIWAPDIIFLNGRYDIFYSFCGVPAANAPCAIGLYTTPTLDSTSPSFKLTDAGMVVNNPMNDATYQFSTIDPGPVVDASGDLWLSWGSGYGKDQSQTQLWLTRLDTTGLPLTSDPAFMPPALLGHPLETGRREGSYLHNHGGTYFLFWNEGSCCSGTSSTYTIWVARSTTGIIGPYSGARVFYAGGGDIHGPGHIGIYSACGVERFTYHYYPTAASVLGENELSWSSDGWPVAGPTSTAPLVPCGNPATGGAGGRAGAGGVGSRAGAGGGGGTGASGGGGTGGGSGAGGEAGRPGPRDASADVGPAIDGPSPGGGGHTGATASDSPGCGCAAGGSPSGGAPFTASFLALAGILRPRRRCRTGLTSQLTFFRVPPTEFMCLGVRTALPRQRRGRAGSRVRRRRR